MTWVRVEFNGREFYVEDDVLRGEKHGPLAPLDHISDGKLDYSRCFSSDTYAHVWPEGVSRFGVKVGELSDLKPVDAVGAK